MVAQMELALPVFINWSTALCWSNSHTLTEVLGGPQHTQKTHISMQKPDKIDCAWRKGSIQLNVDTFWWDIPAQRPMTILHLPNRHAQTHTHTHSYQALEAKPVSPQVVEKRVREAWSQDGPGWLGSSRSLPPCVKMIMTAPAAPRPQRTCVEDLCGGPVWRTCEEEPEWLVGRGLALQVEGRSGIPVVNLLFNKLWAVQCRPGNSEGWRGSRVWWKPDEGN